MNDYNLPEIKFSEPSEVIVSRALDVIVANSNGTISDVSIHSPLTVLVEGLVWTEQEFLAVLNTLPNALLMAMLNTYGYQLAIGSASVGRVAVTLTSPIGSDIVIAPGWRLSSGNLVFVSTTALSIPASSIAGSVDVVSDGVGTVYNVPPGAINAVAPLSPNSPFIASIRNLVGTSGGLDAETMDAAIKRATELLHTRDALITLPDYENSAKFLAGAGSRAIAIPSLGSDKLSKELGCVHVFVLNSNLLPATITQLVGISNNLERSVVAGTAVYVSAVELFEVSVKVIVQLKDGVSPDDAFEVITVAIKNFIDPYNWEASRRSILIKELEYLARNNQYVSHIQGCYLRQSDSQVFSGLNLPLPKPYSLPRLTHITVNMVNNLGEYSYGYGYDPRDTPEPLTQLPGDGAPY